MVDTTNRFGLNTYSQGDDNWSTAFLYVAGFEVDD